jgi:hypothetical protein
MIFEHSFATEFASAGLLGRVARTVRANGARLQRLADAIRSGCSILEFKLGGAAVCKTCTLAVRRGSGGNRLVLVMGALGKADTFCAVVTTTVFERACGAFVALAT